MSTGFFGSYFKRKSREESSNPAMQGSTANSSAHNAEEVRSATSAENRGHHVPASSGTPGQASNASRDSDLGKLFLKYGLKGSPGSDRSEPKKETGSETAYQVKSVFESQQHNLNTSVVPASRSFSTVSTGKHPEATKNTDQSESREQSPLNGVMQDRVLVSLLQEGVVSMPQALNALREQKNHPDVALWRLVASLPGANRDIIFSSVARLAGYKSVHVDEDDPSDELIDAVCGLFPPNVTEELFRLGLVPYEFEVDPEQQQHALLFACFDPSHPVVQQFILSLNLDAELRYSSESAISSRIKAIQQRHISIASSAVAQMSPGDHSEDDDQSHSFTAPSDPLFDPQIRIDPARPEVFSGDGHADITSYSSGMGSDMKSEEVNLPLDGMDNGPDNAPTLKLTGWTGNPGPESTPEEPEEEVTPPDKAAMKASVEAARSKDRVVSMLLRKEIVTPEQVYEALQKQKKGGGKEALWRVLTQLKEIDREAIFAEAARVYAFPVAVFQNGQPDPEFSRSVVETFPEERRKDLFRLRVLPFECDLDQRTGAIKLTFITHDPTRPEVHRLMQQLKLERFELRYASEAIVVNALNEAFPRKNEFLERMSEGSGAYDLGMSYDDTKGKLIDEDALEAEISRSTLINLFEATLVEAVRLGASDVHIYPNADRKVEIHFRVDGRLHLWHTEDKVHPEALLAVIKDNATNVDRFERDAAQDGFIQRWIDDALIRFRVSVLPIANASQELRSESIVIRVLDDRKVITDLAKLGLLDLALERFDQAIHQPHGMVILTGPTGSGKSTTLVAALHQVVTPEVNTLTVEDPVEYIIPGVRQIKLNHKLGLEDALRSILRHDPDVVMVGEMRDRQTAELAIKLANTGHLTFSTLHTNDAPAAISRLYKMGIEPFLIAYAINLVVAQRLIRTLCPACKKLEDDPDIIMLQKLGFSDDEINHTKIYKANSDTSCKVCKGVGYKGRRAVSEALYFSRNIRHLIVQSDKMIDEEAVRDLAVKEGMLTLRDSAREIVKLGETSVQEMIRVVTTEI